MLPHEDIKEYIDVIPTVSLFRAYIEQLTKGISLIWEESMKRSKKQTGEMRRLMFKVTAAKGVRDRIDSYNNDGAQLQQNYTRVHMVKRQDIYAQYEWNAMTTAETGLRDESAKYRRRRDANKIAFELRSSTGIGLNRIIGNILEPTEYDTFPILDIVFRTVQLELEVVASEALFRDSENEDKIRRNYLEEKRRSIFDLQSKLRERVGRLGDEKARGQQFEISNILGDIRHLHADVKHKIISKYEESNKLELEKYTETIEAVRSVGSKKMAQLFGRPVKQKTIDALLKDKVGSKTSNALEEYSKADLVVKAEYIIAYNKKRHAEVDALIGTINMYLDEAKRTQASPDLGSIKKTVAKMRGKKRKD